MQFSSTLLGALTILSSVFCPTVSTPMPVIQQEGRDYNSRFAPVARPVFPRSKYENVTSTSVSSGPTAVARAVNLVERADYADYPGPTASSWPVYPKYD